MFVPSSYLNLLECKTKFTASFFMFFVNSFFWHYAREATNFITSLYCVTFYEYFFINSIELLTAHFILLAKEIEALDDRFLHCRNLTLKYCLNHHQELMRYIEYFA